MAWPFLPRHGPLPLASATRHPGVGDGMTGDRNMRSAVHSHMQRACFLTTTLSGRAAAWPLLSPSQLAMEEAERPPRLGTPIATYKSS